LKKEIKIDIDDKIYVVEITIDENLEIESVMVNEEFIDIKDINSIPNEDKRKHQTSTKINTVDDITQSIDNGIIAPMAGLVLSVEKQVGDHVSEGDLLFVVESMKMEQRIVSDYTGIIYEINVKPNEQIAAGQLMMEFQNSINKVSDNIDSSNPIPGNNSNLSDSQSGQTLNHSIEIIAPMSGVVLKIDKNIGDKIANGDLLFVVESMKMEQMIVSESIGTVKELNVKLNDQVSAGQLMMKIN
jgi:biotin carboxyl carrier protein